MSFQITSLLILIGIIFVFWLLLKKPIVEESKNEEVKFEDDLLYDPDTGAEITLEEAESGQWEAPDYENRLVTEKELEKYYTPEQREVEIVINHLKANNYHFSDFTDNEFELLEKSQCLSPYDEWSYRCVSRKSTIKSVVFFPIITLYKTSRVDNLFSETKLIFLLPINIHGGHYYFKNKSIDSILVNLIKEKSDLKIDDFDTFVFEKSPVEELLKNFIQPFNGKDNLELEII